MYTGTSLLASPSISVFTPAHHRAGSSEQGDSEIGEFVVHVFRNKVVVLFSGGVLRGVNIPGRAARRVNPWYHLTGGIKISWASPFCDRWTKDWSNVR